MPNVPILEDSNPINAHNCCKKFVVDVLPFVPVIAHIVFGNSGNDFDAIFDKNFLGLFFFINGIAKFFE